MTEHLETMPRPETAPCPDWVDAEPFRAHVRDLICETGLSWRLVAAHAGVAPRAVRSLLHGRRGYTLQRLHVSIARALTTTSIESIAADQHLVTDATTTRQLVADLRTAGHGPDLTHHLPSGDLAAQLEAARGRPVADDVLRGPQPGGVHRVLPALQAGPGLGPLLWSREVDDVGVPELDEVAQVIDPRLAVVEEDVDTLGGLAFVLAGRVLEPGESVAHPSGWRLEALDADTRRVTRLRLHAPTGVKGDDA